MVGPSVSTFYFSSTATGFPASLQTFFQAVKGFLPDDVTITVPNTGDIVRDTDGLLQGVWTDTGGSTTQGTDVQEFIIGAGMRVSWVTSGVRGGRRQIGSTFLVPGSRNMMNGVGQINATAVSTVQTAASALVSATTPNMLIWGKPHTKLAADGVSVPVVAAIARSLPSGLRSRRT